MLVIVLAFILLLACNLFPPLNAYISRISLYSCVFKLINLFSTTLSTDLNAPTDGLDMQGAGRYEPKIHVRDIRPY
jgi:hypothetical protein